MGFHVSYLACKNTAARDVCAALGLVHIGTPSDPFETMFSIATLPGGWTVLAANDTFFVAEELLITLSAHLTVLGCQVDEGINYSSTACYADGQQQWMVVHHPELDPQDLQIFHTPPPEFAAIRERLVAQQRETGESDGVDYIFDIPVELFHAITGYRHDRWKFDWGEPAFTKVEAPMP